MLAAAMWVSPAEIEFAVDLPADSSREATFNFARSYFAVPNA
jgi:hypothetical protein